MSIIILLIGISLLISIVFLIAFFWNIKSGQYDDSYTPSVRILFDDESDFTSKGKNKTEKLKNSDSLKEE